MYGTNLMLLKIETKFYELIYLILQSCISRIIVQIWGLLATLGVILSSLCVFFFRMEWALASALIDFGYYVKATRHAF